VGGLKILDGLFMAFLEVVVLFEGEAAFPAAQILHEQLPVLLVEELVVAQFGEIAHHHAFFLLLLAVLDQFADDRQSALLPERLHQY
jgi:hypothetical protein